MNYIFDLDDTLMFSEEAKKKAYFEFIETLGISEKAKLKAFSVLDEAVYKTGERDQFDNAARVIIAMYPELNNKPEYKDPISYTWKQRDFLIQKYITEIKEVTGATELLNLLKSRGAYLGINTGALISFAKAVVKGKNWPIEERFVLGAGDTPDINPYSLQMKMDNIKFFVEEICKKTGKCFEEELKNTTMIGDSYFDYLSAQNMNCKFIGIISRENSKLLTIEEIVKVKNLYEMKVLLGLKVKLKTTI